MKQIQTATDISQLGTILAIWAHPDDETFVAGGILASAVQNGQKVICVTATHGEAGSQNEAKWPLATIGAVRAKELSAALKELGISQHHLLTYADGCCCDVAKQEGCQCVVEFIDRYKPDSILTFGPDGLTGHKDHATVSRWVDLAVAKSPIAPVVYHAVITPAQYHDYLKQVDEKINLFFNIDQPPLIDKSDCDIHFRLPPEVIKIKQQALAAMPSQTEALLQNFDHNFFTHAFGIEAFIKS